MKNNLILIAAVDRNWGIGNDNKLLKRIPEDLKRFSELTTGNIIVVGRKTLESFKDKTPLPQRINIVMTRDDNYICEGAVIVHDIDQLERVLNKYEEDVYVCGGAEIYRQLLPYCKKAQITQIDEIYQADAYLVNLDNTPGWSRKNVGEWQESRSGVCFRYVDYSFEARNILNHKGDLV